MSTNETSVAPGPVPIRPDIFTEPLSPSEAVRLKGSRCRACGEVFLGQALTCRNCGEADFKEVTFSRTGKLWTYTVVRQRPPGDHKRGEPFSPFGLGLVELPEGIRVLSPLSGVESNDLRIGMDLQLVVDRLFTDDRGNEVHAFSFGPIQEAK